jgi:hypothetical protein
MAHGLGRCRTVTLGARHAAQTESWVLWDIPAGTSCAERCEKSPEQTPDLDADGRTVGRRTATATSAATATAMTALKERVEERCRAYPCGADLLFSAFYTAVHSTRRASGTNTC